MPLEEDISTEHLGSLCRIKLSLIEKETLGESLKKILNYMTLLDEVDTQDVRPCKHVLETISNVMREDEEGAAFDEEIFFQNAPDHVGKMIKVPPVIQFEE